MWGNCPQSWEFAYVDGIKRKGSKTFFDLGNYFHELSHVYYQLIEQGGKPGDKFALDYIMSRIRRDLATVSEDNIEIMNRVMKMMSRFITEQSPRIDNRIEILGVELHMEVSYVTPKGRDVILQGYIDLLYRDMAKRVRVRDHKTGANAGSWNQRKLELLPQLLSYLVLVHDFTEHKPIDGEISFINSYDYKKKIPTTDEMFALYRNVYTQYAVDKFREHLLRTMDAILDRKEVGYAHTNYSSDCASCQYFDICTLALRGADTQPVISQRYEKVERDYGTNSLTAVEIKAKDSEKNSVDDEAGTKGNPFVLRWGGTGT